MFDDHNFTSKALSGRESVDLTGPAEGDRRGADPGGDGRRRLDVEDDEGAGGFGGAGSRGSELELEVVDGPVEGVHALLAAVHRHDHAPEVSGGCHGFRSTVVSRRLTFPVDQTDTTRHDKVVFFREVEKIGLKIGGYSDTPKDSDPVRASIAKWAFNWAWINVIKNPSPSLDPK